MRPAEVLVCANCGTKQVVMGACKACGGVKFDRVIWCKLPKQSLTDLLTQADKRFLKSMRIAAE